MKILTRSAIFLLIVFAAIYFGANYTLKKLANRAIAELKPRLEAKGIIVEHFDFHNIRLTSYNSCAVTDVDLKFHLNRQINDQKSFKAEFESNAIVIRFADFENPSLFFTLKDFALLVEPDDKISKNFAKLEDGLIKTRVPVYMRNPEESAREIIDEVRHLFKENYTNMDLELHVNAMIRLEEKEAMVAMYTEREEGKTLLRLNEKDILAVAKKYELKLSEKEAIIISKFPNKVPALIKLTRDAKRLSEMEKARDKAFPEDAYRHVYWSYHLTKELGPELAKEITDAHETLPGNTEKEHQMDFHNNEVGRKYALQNIPVSEIKKRVLQSTDVIKSPNEIRVR